MNQSQHPNDALDEDHVSFEEREDISFLSGRLTLWDRLGHFIAALFLGAIAIWMFWFVPKFLDGQTWGDLVGRFILHDLAFSICLFAVALGLHSIIGMSHVRIALVHATNKLLTILFILVLIVGGTVVCIAAYANGLLK